MTSHAKLDLQAFKNQTTLVLNDINDKSERNGECLDRAAHQLEMVKKEVFKMQGELNHTDYYINKVLPVNQFTQLMTVLRQVVYEQGQLEELKKIHK
jgi:hypothetical protein